MKRYAWIERLRSLLPRERRLRRSLVDVFDEGIPSDARAVLLDRIFSHPDGARDFQTLARIRAQDGALLQELEDLAPSCREMGRLRRVAVEEVRALKARSRTEGRPRTLLVPAAVLSAALILVMAVVLVRRPAVIADAERESRPPLIEAIAPLGEVSEELPEFRWTALRGVRTYRLEIMDRELRTVYRSDLLVSETHRLPAEAAGRLRPGELYFWRVTIMLESGESLRSEFWKFRISGT